MIVETFPDRVIHVNDKDFLYFGGTAYLGLPTHKQFQNKIFEGIRKWGSFYGSSRNSNVKLSIYEEAEAFFANQLQTEASLSISSGTLAGRLAVEHLEKVADRFYHYPKTHPAILSKRSEPLFVEHKLHPDLLNADYEKVVITSDAIVSGEVDLTSFDFIDEIHSSKKITLLIDESHSLGIFDHLVANTIKPRIIDKVKRIITVASLGKALGIAGGIICSDSNFISNVRNESLFVSSSCANAAYLHAFLSSQELIQRQKDRLKMNVETVKNRLKPKQNLRFKSPYPVLYSEDANLYDTLYSQDIIISNFKYPNYEELMNRIVITANHLDHDLDKLVNALNQ